MTEDNPVFPLVRSEGEVEFLIMQQLSTCSRIRGCRQHSCCHRDAGGGGFVGLTPTTFVTSLFRSFLVTAYMDVDTPFTIRFSGIVAGTAAAEIDGVLHFSDFLCRLVLRSVFDRSLFGWRRRRDVHQERVVVDELCRSFARVNKIEGEDGYAKLQSLSNALCPLIDGIFGCDEKVYSFVDDRRVLSAEAFDALHDALEGVLFVVALVLRIDRDGHFEIGKRRLLLPRCQQDSSGFHRTNRI